MQRFAGKALIITGSTGIGAAFARLAAAEGARLLVTGSDEDACFALGAETGAECWAGDLVEAASAESIVAHALAKFGRIDGLFNVAGLSGRRFGDGPVHEATDEGWDLTIARNLTTVFRMCRAVVGRMLVQAPGADGMRGSIVNLGSVLSHAPEPRHFSTHAYAAAKGAVESLSRSMAAAYAAQSIRVNVISPGIVRTAVSELAQVAPGLKEFVGKKQPLSGGMVDSDDVARAALFLLGPDARAITGDVMVVDGGWSVTSV